MATDVSGRSNDQTQTPSSSTHPRAQGGLLIPPDELRKIEKDYARAASGKSSRPVVPIALILVVVIGVGLGVFLMLRDTRSLTSLVDGDSSVETSGDTESFSLSDFNNGVAGFGDALSDAADLTSQNGDGVASSDDTDGDGLSDAREEQLGTDPTSPDTDGDGFLDGEEVRSGFDPLGPGVAGETETAEASGLQTYFDAESGLSFKISDDAEIAAPVVLDGVISESGDTTYPYLKVLSVPAFSREDSAFGYVPLERWQQARLALDDQEVNPDELETIRSVVPIYGDYLRGDGAQPAFIEGEVFTSSQGVRAFDAYHSLPEGDPEPTLAHVTTFIEDDDYAFLFISWYRGRTVSPERLLQQLRDGTAPEELMREWELHMEVMRTVDVADVRRVTPPVVSVTSPGEDVAEEESIEGESSEETTDDGAQVVPEQQDAPLSASALDAFSALLAGAGETVGWHAFEASRLPVATLFPVNWYYADCGDRAAFHPSSIESFCSGQSARVSLERVSDELDASLKDLEEDLGSVVEETELNGVRALRISGDSSDGFVDAVAFTHEEETYVMTYRGDRNSEDYTDAFAGIVSELLFR